MDDEIKTYGNSTVSSLIGFILIILPEDCSSDQLLPNEIRRRKTGAATPRKMIERADIVVKSLGDHETKKELTAIFACAVGFS